MCQRTRSPTGSPHIPTVDMEKYPKAGDPNPLVRIGVVGADGGKVKWIAAGALAMGSYRWERSQRPWSLASDGCATACCWAMALNRVQDRLDIYFVDVQSGNRNVSSPKRPTPGSTCIRKLILSCCLSGDRFLWTSWRDGHVHIYLYQFDKQNPLANEAKQVAQLTTATGRLKASTRWTIAGARVLHRQSGRLAAGQRVRSGTGWQNFHRVSREDGTHGANFGPRRRSPTSTLTRR